MLRLKIIRKIFHQRFKKKTLASLLILTSFILSVNLFTTFNFFTVHNNSYNDKNPKMSWFWATLDLTNPGEINNSLFTHSASISVKGRLYNKINGSIDTSGVNVAKLYYRSFFGYIFST